MNPTDDVLFKELRKLNDAEAGALNSIALMLEGLRSSAPDRRFDADAIWKAVEDRISEPGTRPSKRQQDPAAEPRS
ncbi:MAG: hypothetical protein ACT452_16000 [Microthrixaceae bacterium]